MLCLDIIKRIIHENESVAANCISGGAIEKFDPLLLKNNKKKTLNNILKRTPLQDTKGDK